MAGVIKIVVILRHISHDTEAVRDLHGDHVAGIQQSRDPQLLLSHFKCLKKENTSEAKVDISRHKIIHERENFGKVALLYYISQNPPSQHRAHHAICGILRI